MKRSAIYPVKIVQVLKKTDRIILEMHLGQLFFGIICQLVGAFFVQEQGWYAASLWLGISFSLVAVLHMARTLDRALPLGEAASKMIVRGYLFRYAMILLAMSVAAVSGVLNPLVVFLGYMSLKVTAYLQPFTHKLLNRLFHETDPVAEALPEQETVSLEGQTSSAADSHF